MSLIEVSSAAVLAERRQRRRTAAMGLGRDVLLVAAAGIAAACLGLLLGRPLRARSGMPLVGSLLVSLPRATLLLLLLAWVRRPCALAGAAVSEVITHAALGMQGLGLTAGMAPIAAGVFADLAWLACGKRWTAACRLATAGAVLSGTRVLAAWMFVGRVVPPRPAVALPGPATALAIVGLNVVLGAAAGVLAARFGTRKRKD